MTDLFQLGTFTLNSGTKSFFKIDADALTDDDIKTLAEMIRYMVGPYYAVEGVPRGGIRLANALRPFSLAGATKFLLVDDVLTTSGSMKRLMDTYDDGRTVIGAVVFARGQRPHWIKALFDMPECFLVKPLQRSASS